MSKKVFDKYSNYYDLLYSDKDYKSESDYIIKKIKKYNSKTKSLLDLGCGTGKHDFEFCKKGLMVTGVELSKQMYDIAEKNKRSLTNAGNNILFKKGDIRKIDLKKKYDVIVSLFHVINYQTGNEDLVSTVKTVKKHLKSGGVFMFDFWYGPAVLQDKPVKRLKVMENELLKITRKTIPELKINENTVDVNFEIMIKEKNNGIESILKETHSMRYLFIPELKMIFDENGMKLIHTEEWMTGKNLNDKSWSAFAIAKLK